LWKDEEEDSEVALNTLKVDLNAETPPPPQDRTHWIEDNEETLDSITVKASPSRTAVVDEETRHILRCSRRQSSKQNAVSATTLVVIKMPRCSRWL